MFTSVRAEKHLFAVYQVIDSNCDREMWYSWDKRMADTDFTDECYFLMDGDTKIGGYIHLAERNLILYPFLIPPFCDRFAFWQFLIGRYQRPGINGVTEPDCAAILSFGYRIDRINQVMVRPCEEIKRELAEGFICRRICLERDRAELAELLCKCENGTILTENSGDRSMEQAEKDVAYVFDAYDRANFSRLIMEESTGRTVALCLSGMYDFFAEIGEICVHPEYRGRGLARYLLAEAISEACASAPFMKLLVDVGNASEHIYHRMGFFAGPRLMRMRPRA